MGQNLVCEPPLQASQTEVSRTRPRFDLFPGILQGINRRLARERRRRKVGRAFDMALEIARLVPERAEVLDVGCGNGFIAHHLSALLSTPVVGIDLMAAPEAPIEYRRYDGAKFPAPDNSFDAVLLCYVLHHAQDVRAVLKELRRVLREDGIAIIYEDLPRTWWDAGVCWFHNLKWKSRTGPCTFRNDFEWKSLFQSAGFEVIGERALSRSRNFTHPVCRRLFTLRFASAKNLGFQSDASHKVLKARIAAQPIQARIEPQHWP